jgi:2-phosphosulfolactate phosphatase
MSELSRVLAQDGFSARLDWGPAGAQSLAAGVDVLVIVDVLSFTTSVEVAVARGARVYPCRYGDDWAVSFAQSIGAILAVPRQSVSSDAPYSLSPVSLTAIPAETNLVLPSPNGSAISVLSAQLGRPILAGCLRNAAAVAAAAQARGSVVGIVASGERWRDGGLRPAYEDFVGAGAIIDALPSGNRSPEAQAAVSAFHAAREDVGHHLRNCASGRELVTLGYAGDVQIASALNVSETVPVLREAAYTADAKPIGDFRG